MQKNKPIVINSGGNGHTTFPKTLINFPVKLADRIVFTPVEEIACFYAQDNHVYLYDVRGKEHLVEYTLADLESKLPAQFVRVHRSYIVIHISSGKSRSSQVAASPSNCGTSSTKRS